MANLLFEIGTEELPASYIGPAAEALRSGTVELLRQGGFLQTAAPDGAGAAGEVTATGTPRRLVLYAFNLGVRSPDVTEKIKGPPADRAFGADGSPTQAAQGFARKHGIAPAELSREGGYVWARVRRGGQDLPAFLAARLPEVLRGLPFPKSMRWLPGERTTFARPVSHLLCLLDNDVVPLSFAGQTAGRSSVGHPFHAPEKFTLRDARWGFYKEALNGRKVIVDMDERRERVRRCVDKGAEKCGGRPYNHDGIADRLVEEVANLVEWPGAVMGSFDEQTCREVPEEVIVAAMTGHQRYFPVVDAADRLLPRFVAIANRDPRSGGKASVIRSGNERVLRARLADALFFWRADRKVKLESRLPQLEGVVFHQKLGNMRQKSERISELARWLSGKGGMEEAVAETAARAALLCKCDLVTKVVFEFPELQGIAGKHCAREDGEASSVRQAIEEHYLPRSMDMKLPRSAVGRLVALADKLDSIVGGFAAGLAPTGSKDPYALRRAMLGVIAIVRAARLFRNGPGLQETLEYAWELYRRQGILAEGRDEMREKVLAFARDRLQQVLLDRAASVHVLRAVLAAGFDNIADLESRTEAVSAFARREQFTELCRVVERTRNIVRNEAELTTGRPEPQRALLIEKAEQELYDVYLGTGVKFRAHVREGRYTEASELYLSSFAAPLNRFFAEVFVNAEDQTIRRNRLALLNCIYRMYADSVADLAECAGEAKT